MGKEVVEAFPRTLGARIMLLALSAPAHAQARKAGLRGARRSDGTGGPSRTVPAHAGELEGLKATLIEQRARTGCNDTAVFRRRVVERRTDQGRGARLTGGDDRTASLGAGGCRRRWPLAV